MEALTRVHKCLIRQKEWKISKCLNSRCQRCQKLKFHQCQLSTFLSLLESQNRTSSKMVKLVMLKLLIARVKHQNQRSLKKLLKGQMEDKMVVNKLQLVSREEYNILKKIIEKQQKQINQLKRNKTIKVKKS